MRLFLTVLLLIISSAVFPEDINIKKFGAKDDGKTINTKFIQAAIDKCSESGGRVIIPAGTFISGTIYLKDRVELFLAEGAVLLGSPSFNDYPDIKQARTSQRRHALVYAAGVNHIAITGTGMINGNGQSEVFQLGDDSGPNGNQGRPMIILMVNCKDVLVENLQLKNSAFWMQSYVGCENLHIRGINVYNHANWNNDAIDIDSKNVLIEDCIIDSDDDGLCLKSGDKTRPCENVIIRNCMVSSNCNAIKFGTASAGGFRNINISNITIHKASVDRIRHWQEHFKFIEQPITVIAGIALENVDGGITDNISISNIFMTDVQTPIFVKFGNRLAARLSEGMASPPPGRMRNITLSNITAVSHSKITSSITGFPGYDIENITLNNILISSMGNGSLEESAIQLPENDKLYPENRMFGAVLPSSGLFIRHATGISMNNISLSTRLQDNRVAVIMDDVKNAQVSLLNIADSVVYNAILKLVDCRKVSWFNTATIVKGHPLLVVEGAKSSGIDIYGNSGFRQEEITRLPVSVPAGAVKIH